MADVTYDKNRKKYQVRATIGGRRKYVGRYDTIGEAHSAYLRFITEAHEAKIMSYEHEDKDIQWLKPFRNMKTRLFKLAHTAAQKREARKRLEQYVDEKLNAW